MSVTIALQYVDPGTGSLLAQLFFSFLIGIGFYLVTIRRRIKSWFRRPDQKTEPDGSDQTHSKS